MKDRWDVPDVVADVMAGESKVIKITRIRMSGELPVDELVKVEVRPWPPMAEMAATTGDDEPRDSGGRLRSRLARFRAAFPRWSW